MTARIVIIGGGQAGGWAAKTLRDEGFSGEICVVAEEQWDFYERPPLSKAALLEAEPALPRLFSAEVQQALDLRWYRPLRAKSIDRQNKTLALSNGETLAYDLLLIATGGRARLPSEAWGQHPQVYPAPLAGRAASEAAVGIGNAAGDRRRRLDWPRNRRLGAQKRRSRDPL
ncbi:3-phenylpropionate/cinnamic acid dioxygenase ferredoxin--NAD(+) reductase component [Klebsiella pneumoniae]|nr:FAD-dependent oxidoreductase [Klebsiella pneumoniae]VCW02155.1 3-phenylpropionate/cinnamic acid dioxygenase ferredoxin--NAD(+) reductase component [Klebsiella pneumoniae]